ncbi:MAG: aldehyde dehydrogenase [Geminicoccaceae bacterium]
MIAAVAGWSLVLSAGPSGPARAQDDEFQGLAEGSGQEETYYACTPCHSIHLVKQQRLSRARWEKTLRWMVEEQGMPALEAEEHTLVLDYLVSHYGQDVPR